MSVQNIASCPPKFGRKAGLLVSASSSFRLTLTLFLLSRLSSLESDWTAAVIMCLEEAVAIPLEYQDSVGNYSLVDVGEGWSRNAVIPLCPFANVSEADNETDIVDYYFFPLAMSIPEAISTAVSLSVIMMATVIGNVLVILSVFTYKPLRNAQNMFLVSLAVADITVAIFVMPFNVAYSIMGRWIFGFHACQMWLTCDVLCCTASILNLCAIALDRYWAIHDPISYGQKRTLNRVLLMIAGVWGASAIISIPPLIGWNDWPETFDSTTPCKLTEERGYIIYSSSGSFYIPLVTMTVVYVKIFLATRKRLRQRTKATAKLQAVKSEMVKLQRLPSEHASKKKEETTTCVSCVERGSSSPTNRLSLSGQEDDASFASTTEVQTAGCPAIANPAVNTAHVVTPDLKKVKPPLDRNGSVKNKPPKSNFNVNLFVEQKQKISLSKERRAARVLGIVMGVFVVCWLPFFLMYIILPFCPGCYISDRIVNFITWLGYLNSALNPIIYTIFNLDFRKAFARLLCGTR